MPTPVTAIREVIFGVFYIMTEQNHHIEETSGWAMLLQTIIYLVDTGQVFRVLVITEFGWSDQTTQVLKNFDVVHIFFTVVSEFSAVYDIFICQR